MKADPFEVTPRAIGPHNYRVCVTGRTACAHGISRADTRVIEK
jgi:hypothetical protein